MDQVNPGLIHRKSLKPETGSYLQKLVSLDLVRGRVDVQVAVFEENPVLGRLASQNIEQSRFLSKRVESGPLRIAADKVEGLCQDVSGHEIRQRIGFVHLVVERDRHLKADNIKVHFRFVGNIDFGLARGCCIR